MKKEDDERLWELLGKARTPGVSPRFTADVLRRVRHSVGDAPEQNFLAWLTGRWKVSAATAAFAMLAIGIGVFHHTEQAQPTLADAAIVKSPDLEIIAELDVLIASEDNSAWLEETVVF